MKDTKENARPQSNDPHLDAPSEANRDKHINFLDMEQAGNQAVVINKKDKELEERQKQWKQGIEEGKRNRNRSDE